MFPIVIILSAAVLGCISGATVPEFVGPQLKGRIINGYTTSIENDPWMVKLNVAGSLCGGSIVTERHIVTAAHCVQGVHFANIKVYVGMTFVGTEPWRSLSGYRVHPNYNRLDNTFDIAVLRLTIRLSFNARVNKIEMADVAPPNYALARATGYGLTTPGGRPASQLWAVVVYIISRESCEEEPYAYRSQIKETMLCAGDRKKDTCRGDSGGPLVSGGFLVGVTSWGIGCARPSYPGVYADVARLKPWVWSAINTFL